ncbi:hypothetical protein HDU87_006749 [Geranomyces variabilis]|uniref:Uncharacterized protein n=1 Tax=Geranomyces variabilis TaxID=109894 RepID=A0AAD5TPQ7_9FUNG|nr:hypothetical protein HDU87_006749 [Geranomyces variabilis]
MRLFGLWIWILSSVLALAAAEPASRVAVKSFDLNITESIGAPDCYAKTIRYINGKYPAPAIHVDQSDRLRVTVRNGLESEAISIHFHGIRQLGTPWYDGTSHVSQNAIPAGKEMTLEFSVKDQSGTFLYHAHNAMQELSIFGAVIINEPAEVRKTLHYDDERTIVLSDSWHNSSLAQETGLLGAPFKWVGDPQSLLTNGITLSPNCSYLPMPQGATTGGYAVTIVEPKKTYRFRIINAATLNFLRFDIPGHTMRVIEADGTLLKPTKIDHLELNAGQRYSVLITADQEAKDYWMSSQAMWRKASAQNGWSILRYSNAKTQESTPPAALPARGPEIPSWMEDQLRPLKPPRVPQQEGDTRFYNFSQVALADGTVRWQVADRVYELPDQALLLQHYNNTIKNLPAASKPVSIERGRVVDIVLQSSVGNLNGVCEEHPFHLHGHSFWDLGGGNGTWHSGIKADVNNAILRDTVTVYPYRSAYFQTPLPAGTSCGWRRIRFVADNPGAWLLHCHIVAHLVMGMAESFIVGESNIPALPPHFPIF